MRFYQVGGSVRDKLLGLTSKDVDFAVEGATYDEMVEELERMGCKILHRDQPFFRVLAKHPTYGDVDYVLTRKDGFYKDGRHPETVEPATIEEDLERRDFTMNAIAIDEEGHYIDPHGGVEDIEQRLVRCVGEAEARFEEDGLRMMRALRFCITKGFAIDKPIRMCLHDPTFIEKVMGGTSVERIREELTRMFKSNPLATVRLMGSYNNFTTWLFGKHKDLWFKPTTEKR